MKPYKAIFLDWDDTIGDFHGAARRSLACIYDKHQLQRGFESYEQFYSLYEPHNKWLWEQYGEARVTKDYLEFDRMFFPLTRAPQPFLVDEAISMAMQMRDEHLRLTTDFFSLMPDAEEVVRYLAGKYPLVIVSNGFASVQYEKIRRSGLGDCFRFVVLSEEVGHQKPQPEIFQEALRLGGWKADEVLMIGDAWTSDIQGAINAGIDQLWIQPDETDSALYPSTYRVPRFRDVMQML